MGPTGQRVHLSAEPRQGSGFDQRKLADGELSGETDPTIVFYSFTRVDWYRWWRRGRTRACSSLAMAARRRCMEVHRPLLAMAWPDEKRMGSTVTTLTYRGYLG